MNYDGLSWRQHQQGTGVGRQLEKFIKWDYERDWPDTIVKAFNALNMKVFCEAFKMRYEKGTRVLVSLILRRLYKSICDSNVCSKSDSIHKIPNRSRIHIRAGVKRTV